MATLHSDSDSLLLFVLCKLELVRFSINKQRKVARNTVFDLHFCDSLQKRGKIGFWTGHRPVLIFLLWKRCFGTIFGHFGVGGFLQPFLCASGHSG
jgi:hypothetical protein